MFSIRHQLFDAHASDLRRLFPVLGNVFVCPICFKVFDPESIDKREVNVGHVWPEYIRKGNSKATRQKVLLCTTCNSDAGKNADASMQEFEKIRREHESGHVITPPRVRIASTGRPDKKAIGIGLFIEPKSENTIIFTLEHARTPKQKANNHAIAKRIHEYMSEGPISLIVEPPANARLARVGWLTSAYLLAFFCFGYRYIFQGCLDPVRDQILKSLRQEVDDSLEFAPEKVLTVARWDSEVTPEPRIGMVIPADPSIRSYMSVEFRDAHIRMPVKCIYSIEWEHPPTAEDMARTFFCDGSNHSPHAEACSWEDGFGQPDYCVDGGLVVPKA